MRGGPGFLLMSRPLSVSEEISVWSRLEVCHHQGLRDAPVQKLEVMSHSHCQPPSDEESLENLFSPGDSPAEAVCLGWEMLQASAGLNRKA